MSKRELLQWTFGVVSILILGGFILWFYIQNLRRDAEPLSLTIFNVGIILCVIVVALIVAWRNSDATWWVSGILAILSASFFFYWAYWSDLRDEEESLSTTVRNLGLISAACVATTLAVWRSIVGERQAKTAHRQADTAEQNALDDRYERATESLSSGVLWVRLGGIYSLQRLAEEYPTQYHVQVMQLLCAFVRSPIEDPTITLTTTGPPRDDVQNAMTAIGRRDGRRIRLELDSGFKLDLRSANLTRVWLRDANLSKARLDEADLTEATFIGADLSSVSLWLTNLSSVLFAQPPNGEGNAADKCPVQGLTQEMLDQACADSDKPPRQLNEIRDTTTGRPLRWRGGPC